jgi:hypothetical protein
MLKALLFQSVEQSETIKQKLLIKDAPATVNLLKKL